MAVSWVIVTKCPSFLLPICWCLCELALNPENVLKIEGGGLEIPCEPILNIVIEAYK